MAVKPTEVKLILGLLDDEWDDVTDLAKAIVTQLDEKRERDDNPHMLIAQYRIGEGIFTKAFGPFATANAATKFVGRLAAPGPEQSRCMVVRVTSPKEVD